MGTSTRRRRAARPATSGQGCSTYCRPPAALSSSGRTAAAVVGSQAPLTSTRIRPRGPSALRTASRRRRSASRPLDAEACEPATFTLAVSARDRLTRVRAAAGETSGIVTLTGTLYRFRGSPVVPARAHSSPEASHGTEASRSWSQKGATSPHPAPPWSRTPSRRVMPRKRVVILMSHTTARSMPSRSPEESWAFRACRSSSPRTRSGEPTTSFLSGTSPRITG